MKKNKKLIAVVTVLSIIFYFIVAYIAAGIKALSERSDVIVQNKDLRDTAYAIGDPSIITSYQYLNWLHLHQNEIIIGILLIGLVPPILAYIGLAVLNTKNKKGDKNNRHKDNKIK